MEDKKILLDNIDKIHTTEMGVDRIKRNLKIDTADVVEYCKNKVLDKNCNIYKQGKNWLKWLKSWSSFEKGKAGFSYFPSEDLQLRVISEIQPELECMSVPATLEDAYIYFTNRYNK